MNNDNEAYDQNKMEVEAARELVQSLELVKESVAVGACIAYLEGKGYSIVRIT